MPENSRCKLCGSEEAALDARRSHIHRSLFNCPRCGTYWLTDLAQHCEPTPGIAPRLHLLSGLSRAQHELGTEPLTVTVAMISEADGFEREVASRAPSGIRGKAKAILRYVAKRSAYPGHEVAVFPTNDFPVGFCKAEDEFRFYLLHLQERGLLKVQFELAGMDGSLPSYVTAQGWDELSGDTRREQSDQCFVAMWFDAAVADAFALGILPLEATTRFRMLRIDMQQFNEKICDRILAEIKSSRFMIADVTGHRHAVYFEAGIAMGLGLPVIWCCREDDIGNCPNFDTRQYNHVLWNSPEELREKLAARIAATILTQEEAQQRRP